MSIASTIETSSGLQAGAGTRVCVLLNSGSGSGDAEEREAELRRHFARHPDRFELRLLRHGGLLPQMCREIIRDGFDTVVAAGGDGTISGVAANIAGKGPNLGILPMGTFNYVARALNIPEDPGEAVDLIAKGEAREMSLGEVNGHVFLNNASLGIYPQVLREREGTYKKWGRSRLAAHWSVLKTFAGFRSPIRMKVTVDGTVYRAKTPLAFVARSAFQLEQFGLEGVDCVRRGQFALFLAPDSSRMALLGRAIKLAGGGMHEKRDFELICGDEIVIETLRPSHLIAMDGEQVAMQGPFRFRMRHNALKVIAPPGEENAEGI